MAQKYSVVLIVPDHGDRTYVEAMSHLLLSVMGFNQIAVHQVRAVEERSSAKGLGRKRTPPSSARACPVLVLSTLVLNRLRSPAWTKGCPMPIQGKSPVVREQNNRLIPPRINLSYGGDDITVALSSIMQRSAFPYRDLDLSKSQQWLMMDNLKIKICTLEEVCYRVASHQGLTEYTAPGSQYTLGLSFAPDRGFNTEVHVSNVR